MKKIKANVGDTEYEVGIEELENNRCKISLDNEVYVISIGDRSKGIGIEEIDENKWKVTLKEAEHIVELSDEIEEHLDADLAEQQNIIRAHMPGTISQIKVKVGDEVKKGTTLITLLAMKMENNIVSQKSGKVKEIKVKVNQAVDMDQELIILE